MAAENRLFNGIMFYNMGYYNTKRDAQDHARSQRKDGSLVRVVKAKKYGKTIYQIWEREGKRKRKVGKR